MSNKPTNKSEGSSSVGGVLWKDRETNTCALNIECATLDITALLLICVSLKCTHYVRVSLFHCTYGWLGVCVYRGAGEWQSTAVCTTRVNVFLCCKRSHLHTAFWTSCNSLPASVLIGSCFLVLISRCRHEADVQNIKKIYINQQWKVTWTEQGMRSLWVEAGGLIMMVLFLAFWLQ